MTALTLTLVELGGIVAAAVALSATDAAAISRLAIAVVAKRLGVKPGEIMRYDAATEGEGT